MAFSRKFQGKGQVGTSDTQIYAPQGNSVGTVGVLSFFNTSATDQVTVTIYSPHTGTPDRIIDKAVINPEKPYTCRAAINQVIEAGWQISAVASVAATVDFTCSGAEE